tara:strand:- start:10357 stop:11697 length:1341 start_codon:yes stop_codon:yes gene_type:complete
MVLDPVEKKQIFYIKKSLSLLKGKKKNIDTGINPGCYLSSWADEIGLLTLKSYSSISFSEKSKLILKYFYKHINFSDIIVNHTSLKNKNYKRLIVSWGDHTDIKKNSFHDKYFSKNCKDNQNTLWLIITSENDFHKIKSKDNNLILVTNKKNFLIPILKNIDGLFKLVFKNDLPSKLQALKIPNFYVKLSAIILNYIKEKKISEILMPYECQPFQHYIFKDVKKFSNSIKTIGYIHSALTPLPTDFIARSNHPDKIIVHGNGQKKILTNFLNWNKKNIIFRPSARFLKRKKKRFTNKIILPMSFQKENQILENFEFYLNSQESKTLHPFKIQNHPNMTDSKKHKDLITNLEKILFKYKNKFKDSSRKKISIFIAATAAIIEALEEGTKVIHIFSDPIFESHSKVFWRDINIKKINRNTSEYSMPKKSKFIVFGKKYKKIDKWLKKI